MEADPPLGFEAPFESNEYEGQGVGSRTTTADGLAQPPSTGSAAAAQRRSTNDVAGLVEAVPMLQGSSHSGQSRAEGQHVTCVRKDSSNNTRSRDSADTPTTKDEVQHITCIRKDSTHSDIARSFDSMLSCNEQAAQQQAATGSRRSSKHDELLPPGAAAAAGLPGHPDEELHPPPHASNLRRGGSRGSFSGQGGRPLDPDASRVSADDAPTPSFEQSPRGSGQGPRKDSVGSFLGKGSFHTAAASLENSACSSPGDLPLEDRLKLRLEQAQKKLELAQQVQKNLKTSTDMQAAWGGRGSRRSSATAASSVEGAARPALSGQGSQSSGSLHFINPSQPMLASRQGTASQSQSSGSLHYVNPSQPMLASSKQGTGSQSQSSGSLHFINPSQPLAPSPLAPRRAPAGTESPSGTVASASIQSPCRIKPASSSDLTRCTEHPRALEPEASRTTSYGGAYGMSQSYVSETAGGLSPVLACVNRLVIDPAEQTDPFAATPLRPNTFGRASGADGSPLANSERTFGRNQSGWSASEASRFGSDRKHSGGPVAPGVRIPSPIGAGERDPGYPGRVLPRRATAAAQGQAAGVARDMSPPPLPSVRQQHSELAPYLSPPVHITSGTTASPYRSSATTDRGTTVPMGLYNTGGTSPLPTGSPLPVGSPSARKWTPTLSPPPERGAASLVAAERRPRGEVIEAKMRALAQAMQQGSVRRIALEKKLKADRSLDPAGWEALKTATLIQGKEELLADEISRMTGVARGELDSADHVAEWTEVLRSHSSNNNYANHSSNGVTNSSSNNVVISKTSGDTANVLNSGNTENRYYNSNSSNNVVGNKPSGDSSNTAAAANVLNSGNTENRYYNSSNSNVVSNKPSGDSNNNAANVLNSGNTENRYHNSSNSNVVSNKPSGDSNSNAANVLNGGNTENRYHNSSNSNVVSNKPGGDSNSNAANVLNGGNTENRCYDNSSNSNDAVENSNVADRRDGGNAGGAAAHARYEACGVKPAPSARRHAPLTALPGSPPAALSPFSGGSDRVATAARHPLPPHPLPHRPGPYSSPSSWYAAAGLSPPSQPAPPQRSSVRFADGSTSPTQLHRAATASGQGSAPGHSYIKPPAGIDAPPGQWSASLTPTRASARSWVRDAEAAAGAENVSPGRGSGLFDTHGRPSPGAQPYGVHPSSGQRSWAQDAADAENVSPRRRNGYPDTHGRPSSGAQPYGVPGPVPGHLSSGQRSWTQDAAEAENVSPRRRNGSPDTHGRPSSGAQPQPYGVPDLDRQRSWGRDAADAENVSPKRPKGRPGVSDDDDEPRGILHRFAGAAAGAQARVHVAPSESSAVIGLRRAGETAAVAQAIGSWLALLSGGWVKKSTAAGEWLQGSGGVRAQSDAARLRSRTEGCQQDGLLRRRFQRDAPEGTSPVQHPQPSGWSAQQPRGFHRDSPDDMSPVQHPQSSGWAVQRRGFHRDAPGGTSPVQHAQSSGWAVQRVQSQDEEIAQLRRELAQERLRAASFECEKAAGIAEASARAESVVAQLVRDSVTKDEAIKMLTRRVLTLEKLLENLGGLPSGAATHLT